MAGATDKRAAVRLVGMTNINWNGDAESAPFKSRFDDESENLILAETDTGTGLFEWDGSAWQFRGPVEMNGEDVSGIGSLTATSGNFDSVNTEEASITERTRIRANLPSNQSIASGETTVVEFETGDDNLGEWDNNEHSFSPNEGGFYDILAQVQSRAGSPGDELQIILEEDGSTIYRKNMEREDGPFGRATSVLSLLGVELDSTSTYSISYRNLDSDDELDEDSRDTYLFIKDSFHREGGT